MINKLLLLILLTTTVVMGASLLSEDYRSPSGQITWTTTLTGGSFGFGAVMPYNITPGGLLTITDGTLDCYMVYDPVTAHDSNYYQEYLYVDSTNIANGEVINLFRSGVDASSATWRLVISKAAAGYQFYVIYRVTNNSNVETGRKVINWDTRYGVRVKYDRTNRNVQFIVDGVTITDTTVEAMDRTMGHFIVGSPANLNTGDKYIKLYRDHLSINDNAFADPVNLPTKTPNCSLLVRTSGGSGNETVSPSGWTAATNCSDSIRIIAAPSTADSFKYYTKNSDSVTFIDDDSLNDTGFVKNVSDTLLDTVTAVFCTKGLTCIDQQYINENVEPTNIHNSMGFDKSVWTDSVTNGDTTLIIVARGVYQELWRGVNGVWTPIDTAICIGSSIIKDSANFCYWFFVNDGTNNIQFTKFRFNTTGNFSYTNIGNVGTTEAGLYRNVNCAIDSNNAIFITSHGGNPDSIFAFRTENGGNDWTKCTSPSYGALATDGWYAPHIVVNRKNILFCTYQRWGGTNAAVIVIAKSFDKGDTWDTTWYNTADTVVRYPYIVPVGDSSMLLLGQKQQGTTHGAVSAFSGNLGDTLSRWFSIFSSSMASGSDVYGDPVGTITINGNIYTLVRRLVDSDVSHYRAAVYKSIDTGKTWDMVEFYNTDTTCGAKNAMSESGWYTGGYQNKNRDAPTRWLFTVHTKADVGDTTVYDYNDVDLIENKWPYTSSITITSQPVSDTLTAGVPTISAAWTGDSVQHAWWWYHAGDSTYITDSVFSKSVTSANNGDSVKLVLWNISDTISGNTAFIRVVYAVFDSLSTDSTKIYLSGNFLSGEGWTATLSDSILTTTDSSSTILEFTYNHKIILNKKRYRLNITDGIYSIQLLIGSDNKRKLFFFFGGK